ncbi:MAG TPA: Lrp/AsnC family transcriptional regulator [Thermomicrobiales bacterium]|nr:Lrp/AsnC family transcriptional regulator [Thermomicrobiales bacterium]
MSQLPGSQVDDLDLRIIGALQLDGRRSVLDIARELDVPRSTVQRRLDNLIREKIIMVAAYADSSKLGLGIHAHLNLRVALAQADAVIQAVSALTEVRWLAVTTGPADIVAEAYFASSGHLHEFITTKLAGIPGITAVETSVILKVAKLTFHWDELLRESAHHAPPHVLLSIPAQSYGARSTPLRVAATPDIAPRPEAHCRSPGAAERTGS